MTIHIDNGSSSGGGGAGYTTDTSNLVPYIGATSDLLLSTYRLSAAGVTAGTLQGILAGTGGSVFSVGSTGSVGQVLQSDGDNTYTWITLTTASHNAVTIGVPSSGLVLSTQELSLKTAGVGVDGAVSAGDWSSFTSKMANITTGIISGLLPITTDNTRYALGGAVQLSLNTATIWATTLSSTNTYSTYFSGGTIGIGAITCGTLQGVVISTGGTFSALATGAVGRFLAQSGANVYGWFNTSAAGGLGTDTVVPYTGAMADVFLGPRDLQATTISGVAFIAESYSGGTLSATGITCGTLDGILIGTGGTISTIGMSPGDAGMFLYYGLNNTYGWANTSAVGGLGTDVVVPYLSAVSDLVLNKRFMATGITCGTLQGVVVSTGGSFSAIATGAVGTFLSHTGANVYAWSATSAAGAQTTGILSANAPLTTSGLSHVATAAQTLSITTAIVAISAPLSTSAVFTTITAAQTLSITTGVLTANPPLTTSAVVSLISGAKTIGITTAIVSISAPLSTSAVFTTITAAQTLSITTGVLTCNPPLTTSAVVSLLSAAKTIGITTAIVSIVAPLSTSAVFTCISAAQTLSINTATIWAVTLSASGTVYATTLSSKQITVGTMNVSSSATPILKSAGEVMVDSTTTTGSAIQFYSDLQYALPAYYSKSFLITTPAGAATYMLWKVPYNLTLRNAFAYCAGGTVTGALYEADGNGATVSTATVSKAVSGTTTTALVIANASIDAGDFIDWITTTTGGTPTQLSCSFYYTMDT